MTLNFNPSHATLGSRVTWGRDPSSNVSQFKREGKQTDGRTDGQTDTIPIALPFRLRRTVKGGRHSIGVLLLLLLLTTTVIAQMHENNVIFVRRKRRQPRWRYVG